MMNPSHYSNISGIAVGNKGATLSICETRVISGKLLQCSRKCFTLCIALKWHDSNGNRFDDSSISKKVTHITPVIHVPV